MKKLLLFTALLVWMLLIVPFRTEAAFTTAGTNLQAATTSADTVTKKGWWTAEVETANNSSFYGRNTIMKFPYAAAGLTYVHNSGLWASATSYQLFNTEAFVDETDLSVGYTFKAGKYVTNNLIYSRFFFSENSPLLKAVTSNAVSAYSAVDWGILLTSLTTSYVFGGSNDLFVVLENSRYLALNPLWKGKLPIGIDPKISVIAGTQEFSQTYTHYVQEARNNGGLTGGALDPLNLGKGNGKGNGNGSNGSTTSTTTVTERKFQVLNYELKVPLVITLGSFEVEPSWRYSIPVNLVEGDESKAQSFFAVKGNFTF